MVTALILVFGLWPNAHAIHEDFKISIARQEDVDHFITQWEADLSKPAPDNDRRVTRGTQRLVEDLIREFDLRPYVANPFRRQTLAMVRSLPALNEDQHRTALELDAEMLAHTFAVMFEATDEQHIRERRAQALPILQHAYVLMGQGSKRGWAGQLLDLVPGFDPAPRAFAYFWIHARRVLSETRAGLRTLEHDDEYFGIRGPILAAEDPAEIARRVIRGLGGVGFNLTCERRLGLRLSNFGYLLETGRIRQNFRGGP